MSNFVASAEYTFGPPISVRTDIGADLHPVKVDLVKLGQNLQKDFPGLRQEDWAKTRVVLADLEPNIGGVSAELAERRRSLVARYANGLVAGLISCLLNYPSIVKSFRKLNALSEGADVITLVNAAAEKQQQVGRGQNPFVDESYETSLSEILSHELKHTADTLYNAQHLDKVDPKLRNKHIRVGAAYFTGIIGGLAVAGTGGLEIAYLVTGWNEKVAEIGSTSVISGTLLAAPLIYQAVKNGKLESARFGYEIPEPPYATSEEATYAYQLATKSDWQAVLVSGEAN